MLRFLSRRRGRNATSSDNQNSINPTNNTASQIKSQRLQVNKNLIQCRVILLDGTDLSVDLTVSMDYEFFLHYLHCIARQS